MQRPTGAPARGLEEVMDTMRSVMDTMRSLHLEVCTGGSSEHDTKRSWLAESSTDGAEAESGTETGPDAAAGRSRRKCELQLPIEACKGSNVASMGVVQLQRSLSDTASLHKRAMCAIDRIARQHAALRRFPMVCPSCSVINSPPSGRSWGAGDIVVCQGCGRSYVPLGQLQDSDLAVLRTAVQQMWAQSERLQHLELVVARSRSAPAGTSVAGARPKSSETSCLERTTRTDGRSDGGHLRQSKRNDLAVRSPVAVRSPPAAVRSPGRRSPTPAGSSVDEAVHAGGHGLAPKHRRPLSPPAFFQELRPWGARPQAPHREQLTENETSSPPKLLSLVDTQDLLTSSSTGSGPPCILGAVVRPHQPAFDTWQDVQQEISAAQAAMRSRFRLREREEGELTSELPSEGEITSCSDTSFSPLALTNSKPSSLPTKATRLVVAAHAVASRVAGPPVAAAAAPSDAGASTSEVFLSPRPDESQQVILSEAERRAAWRLASLLAAVFAVRLVLRQLAGATSGVVGQAIATTLFAVVLAVGGLATLGMAQRSLDQSRSMDTSPQSSFCWGYVNLRVRGPRWMFVAIELTFEEALGLACVLLQLTILFICEVWGLYGPRSHCWLAVACHAGAAWALVAVVRLCLARTFPVAGSEDTPVLWLCVAACNWATMSWAAATWWLRAAIAIEEGEERNGRSPGRAFPTHVPIIAAVAVHALSLWIARLTHRPMLLFASVILSGVSMAYSCHMHPNQPSLWLVSAPWASVVFPVFCAASAWTLWHELVRSL